MKWKHFPRYWPFVPGILRSPGNSPHKGQWLGALIFSLICVWINGLSKQPWGWWFETPSRPLWRHRNVVPTGWYLAVGSKPRSFKQIKKNILNDLAKWRLFCSDDNVLKAGYFGVVKCITFVLIDQSIYPPRPNAPIRDKRRYKAIHYLHK